MMNGTTWHFVKFMNEKDLTGQWKAREVEINLFASDLSLFLELGLVDDGFICYRVI